MGIVTGTIVTLDQSIIESNAKKYVGYITRCDNSYSYNGTWSPNTSVTGIGVSVSDSVISVWNTNSTTEDVSRDFTWTSSKLSDCTKKFTVVAKGKNCPTYNVILVSVFNDDSDGLLESVSGNVQLYLYSVVGSGGTSSDAVCSNAINKVGEVTSQPSTIPNNCSGVDNVKFIFNNINLTCSFSGNIGNFTVSGGIEYRLGDSGSYTTLKSVDNYTISTTSNSATIGECSIEDTTLWAMMDGSKTLYLKHIITMNYNTCEYKWFIYTSEDTNLNYTYGFNCNGLSGSDLSGHYMGSNCHGLANICGDNKEFVPIKDLIISIDGDYSIGSTKVTSDMIILTPCNNLSTHFGIYTTDEFANAVDNVTSNFDITVPFKISYEDSPIITFNLNWSKTDYVTCPVARFNLTEITTAGESTIFSNSIIIENWNGVTDYDDWDGGNNLKLEFYDSEDNKMDDSGFIINEIGKYIEPIKTIHFSLKLTDSIVTITNKLQLRLICTLSNTVLSTLRISQNFGYFVIAFSISTSLINNFTNAILNLITNKGIIELAGINQSNINDNNVTFYKFIKPVFENIGYNNCTTVNCRFSVSGIGQYTPSISLNGSSIDNKSVSINTCANIGTIYTITVNLSKN